MSVTYWLAYPTQYRLVQRWLPGQNILQCLAPFTPVRLIRETAPRVTASQLHLFV
jgi:hypothetical protein